MRAIGNHIAVHAGSSILGNEALRRMAPALFAEAPAPSTSGRYAFLRTIDVVEGLRKEGWMVTNAVQGGNPAREDASTVRKHAVRFRHGDAALVKSGDAYPELVMLSSHDGKSAYQLHLGLLRSVCLNGLILDDGTFGHVSVRHSRVTLDEVVEASLSMVKEMPRIGATVEAMRATELTVPEQRAFARAALTVRWDDAEKPAPLEPEALLEPRRYDDAGPDLWRTFNRVQENAVRGGQHYRRGRRTLTTRPIRAVADDTRLNKALFALAAEMLRLKGGAA